MGDPTTVGRGWSSFSKTQQHNAHVVLKGMSTPNNVCLHSGESRSPGSTQCENRTAYNQKSICFRRRKLRWFLQYFLQCTEGKAFLILDNATWHRARDLKGFFSDNQDRLVWVFLPPYCPELDPIETVWRITRRTVTHNRYFTSVKELETALASYFTKWEQPNGTLRVLCANI